MPLSVPVRLKIINCCIGLSISVELGRKKSLYSPYSIFSERPFLSHILALPNPNGIHCPIRVKVDSPYITHFVKQKNY